MGLFGRKKTTPQEQQPEPVVVETAEELHALQAAQFVSFAEESIGIAAGVLNFKSESLNVVDEALEEFHRHNIELPQPMWEGISSYIMETARREYGGSYKPFQDQNPWVLVIGEPEFNLGFMAMSKVLDRVRNGEEDSIPFFYEGLEPLVRQKRNATLV
ncbi:hypothetical protein [Psychromicrobium sp. YIM B11713]|uniref:hypothetical protein n=1 Tax=Psychromicrobium sp. YIM B11713 TaxID=3145233 RepID=UPI00374F246D